MASCSDCRFVKGPYKETFTWGGGLFTKATVQEFEIWKCHRYPKAISTKATRWCGEHQPKTNNNGD